MICDGFESSQSEGRVDDRQPNHDYQHGSYGKVVRKLTSSLMMDDRVSGELLYLVSRERLRAWSAGAVAGGEWLREEKMVLSEKNWVAKCLTLTGVRILVLHC